MKYLLSTVAIAACLAVSALPLAAQQRKGGQDSGGGYSPPRNESKSKIEIDTQNKSVTIPLTRDGNYRFGVQDMSKEPTREIPQGEKGGVFFFEKRF